MTADRPLRISKRIRNHHRKERLAGLVGATFLVFLVMRLAGYTDWVVSPLLATPALFVAVAVPILVSAAVATAVLAVADWVADRKRPRRRTRGGRP